MTCRGYRSHPLEIRAPSTLPTQWEITPPRPHWLAGAPGFEPRHFGRAANGVRGPYRRIQDKQNSIHVVTDRKPIRTGVRDNVVMKRLNLTNLNGGQRFGLIVCQRIRCRATAGHAPACASARVLSLAALRQSQPLKRHFLSRTLFYSACGILSEEDHSI
jgi:hypothetical protein